MSGRTHKRLTFQRFKKALLIRNDKTMCKFSAELPLTSATRTERQLFYIRTILKNAIQLIFFFFLMYFESHEDLPLAAQLTGCIRRKQMILIIIKLLKNGNL